MASLANNEETIHTLSMQLSASKEQRWQDAARVAGFQAKQAKHEQEMKEVMDNYNSIKNQLAQMQEEKRTVSDVIGQRLREASEQSTVAEANIKAKDVQIAKLEEAVRVTEYDKFIKDGTIRSLREEVDELRNGLRNTYVLISERDKRIATQKQVLKSQQILCEQKDGISAEIRQELLKMKQESQEALRRLNLERDKLALDLKVAQNSESATLNQLRETEKRLLNLNASFEEYKRADPLLSASSSGPKSESAKELAAVRELATKREAQLKEKVQELGDLQAELKQASEIATYRDTMLSKAIQSNNTYETDLKVARAELKVRLLASSSNFHLSNLPLHI
jgi:chromosome segregation ATPase